MVKGKEGKKEVEAKLRQAERSNAAPSAQSSGSSEESNKAEYHNHEEINERKYSTRLACSESTKKLIMEDCIEDFLSHHPELSGINVTQNMILRQIAEYYLKH